jgi:hypothetical protein
MVLESLTTGNGRTRGRQRQLFGMPRMPAKKGGTTATQDEEESGRQQACMHSPHHGPIYHDQNDEIHPEMEFLDIK